MSVADLFKPVSTGRIIGQCSVFIVSLLTLIQIAPIKINPWSWLFKLPGKAFSKLAKRVGRAINGEVITELVDIKHRLSDLEDRDKKQDGERAKNEALNARRRILRFSDELRQKVKHSEEHFKSIFDDIKDYEAYCDEHKDFKNDRVRISVKIIEDTYEKCLLDNSFL